MTIDHITVRSTDQEYKLIYAYVIKEWKNNHNRNSSLSESDWLLFKECNIRYDIRLDLESHRPLKILEIQSELLSFILLSSNYD